jgi:polyhydroxybutyrate depolymerase
MQYSLLLVAAFTLGQTDPLGPGNYKRTITVDDLKRVHRIHVPPKYDPKKPSAVVLALHGLAMFDELMEGFTGLSKSADEHNFIVVYPNGTGLVPSWNAGLFPGELNKMKVDDVKYLGKVLDDVESVLKVDRKRVYATGLSNGGMMCYRLASEMSDRIAAIAPVAGTMAVEKYEPKRPIPVVHFHGTKDTLVPFNAPDKKLDLPKFMKFRSVPDTIAACVKANGCDGKVTETEMPMNEDKIRVIRKDYGKCKNGAEVVLYVIEAGGHTWPGAAALPILGLSTMNISANDIMWAFFEKHPLK